MSARLILGVAAVLVATAGSSAAALEKPFERTCDTSVYGDLGPRWLENAVRAGPVTFIGARGSRLVARDGATAVKLLVVVEPRFTVTVSVARRTRPFASLLYDPAKFHIRHPRVADGAGAVRFVACFNPNGRAPWERGTQFNGLFVVFGPRCVPVQVVVRGRPHPLRRNLAFGVPSCPNPRS